MNWIINKILKFTGTQKFLSIQLDITNACNLDCRHCYQSAHSGGGDLSIRDWREILDQYHKLSEKLCLTPNFFISGGEPTISPIFPDILSELSSRWPAADIALLTNGTALSDGIVAEVLRYKVDVQISVDGPDSEKHDYIRGAGNFEKSMQGLKALQRAGRNAIFQAVLSNRTVPWIPDFFEMAKRAGAAVMNFTRFVQQGKGKSLCEQGGDRPIHGLELKKAYIEIISASKESGISTGTNLPLFTLIAPELGAHGKFGFQGLVIDYQGNLKVSSRADFRVGNILKSGLDDLFLNHAVMKRLRTNNIEVCGVCQFYDRCGGDRNASYATYGSFFKKDPGCWL